MTSDQPEQKPQPAGQGADVAPAPAQDDAAPVDAAGRSSLHEGFGATAAGIEQLIDDHEEEVSENGRTVKRRGVFLLPNLFTTGALFCGFYAVVAAMRGDLRDGAPIAILFALVFDGLDGRVARLTNTASKFGAEYDSLVRHGFFRCGAGFGHVQLGARRSWKGRLERGVYLCSLRCPASGAL
jgi:hypothetical protein